jgi:phage portal protein BeeE
MGSDSGGGAYPIGPHGPWTHHQAAAQPVVTRATALITGPLTSAPFRLLDGNGQPLPTPLWLSDPMMSRPDDRSGFTPYPDTRRLARSLFWAGWIRSAIWWGHGAFIYQQDNAGAPARGTLHLVNPHQLSTTAVKSGDSGWRWQLDSTDGGPAAVFDSNGAITLADGTTYWLCVLRNPHSPVDDSGMSRGVFAMSPSAFRLAAQIDAYTAGQFRAGVPNGYLKTSVPGMTQGAADQLKAEWMARHGGDARSVAILNSTTEFVPINLSPVDTAVDQVKRLNVADVAFAFALDPMTLGAGLNNSATYTNLRDAWENHRDFGLAPWQAAAQDTLSALTTSGTSVAINLDGFANPAPSERFAAYKVAIDSGVLSVDEARALEGLPPRDEPAPAPAPPALVPVPTPEPTALGGA